MSFQQKWKLNKMSFFSSVGLSECFEWKDIFYRFIPFSFRFSLFSHFTWFSSLCMCVYEQEMESPSRWKTILMFSITTKMLRFFFTRFLSTPKRYYVITKKLSNNKRKGRRIIKKKSKRKLSEDILFVRAFLRFILCRYCTGSSWMWQFFTIYSMKNL